MKQLNKYARVAILSTAVAFLAYASTTFYKTVISPENVVSTESSASLKVTSGNYNAQLVSRGYERVSVDKSKPEIFYFEQIGDFNPLSMIRFMNTSESIAINASEGDELYISIMSNGGSALACNKMADEIDLLKEELNIKVTAVVDVMAMSCGYMLAASADRILMSRSAMIGNIGVVRTYVESVGSSTPVASVNGSPVRQKAIGSSRVKEVLAGSPVNSEGDVKIQRELMERSAQQFFDYVSNSRGERLTDKERAFSGHYFGYNEALEIGLIDGSGSIRSELRRLHREGYQITKVD